MNTLMHKLFILSLLMSLLICTGCKSINRARHASDIPVEVTLSRSWACRVAPEQFKYDDWEFECNNIEIEEIEHLLVIPIGLLIHQCFEVGYNGLVYFSNKAQHTKFVVYPNGNTTYRQRLYWGTNTVYFPLTEELDRSYLKIVVSGDRKAVKSYPVNLQKIDNIALK